MRKDGRTEGMMVAALAGLVLAGCGSGTPATVDEVKELMKKDFGEDGYTVSWVGVTPTDKPGEFKVIVDRLKGGDSKTEQTQLCNVSATSYSNSRTCQTVDPSIMNQAAELLTKQYEGRQIQVREYTLKRTGEGARFAGHFILTDPASGVTVKVPCAGVQDDTRFDINCDQDGATEVTSG